MSAYTSGASWSFPDDLPGGWVKVDADDEDDDTATSPPPIPSAQRETESKPQPAPTSPPHSDETSHTPHQQPPRPDHQQKQQPPPKRKRTHYPPRQCRICLDTVYPTTHTPSPISTSLPSPFHPAPHITYDSPAGEGGRLLRPCKCKGSQKHVHEECLRSWRMQDPLQKRNFYQCPTCGYKYQLRRLTWAAWISSAAAQIGLTVAIFWLATFVLGFVGDWIIDAYLDPVSLIVGDGGEVGRAPSGIGRMFSSDHEDYGGRGGRYGGMDSTATTTTTTTWLEHFLKGLASLGLLGFAKFLLTLGPWNWFHMRGGGVYYIGGGGGGGGGGFGSRAGHTGRDRLSQLSWVAILVGVVTFLYAVWKGVRTWSRRTLEKAGERVMDVPGEDDDDEEEEEDGVGFGDEHKEDDRGERGENEEEEGG